MMMMMINNNNNILIIIVIIIIISLNLIKNSFKISSYIFVFLIYILSVFISLSLFELLPLLALPPLDIQIEVFFSFFFFKNQSKKEMDPFKVVKKKKAVKEKYK